MTEIGRFTAKYADGTEVTVHVIGRMVDTHTQLTPREKTISGLSELRLADGEHVNKVGPGKYQIVESGEILTSDDPRAI